MPRSGLCLGVRAGDWDWLLGLWHDIGKYSAKFQRYLGGSNGAEAHLEENNVRVDHSTAGAQLAARSFAGRDAGIGRILAYCIAGHHAGLADAVAEEGTSGLDDRLKKAVPDIAPSQHILSREAAGPRKRLLAGTLDAN